MRSSKVVGRRIVSVEHGFYSGVVALVLDDGTVVELWAEEPGSCLRTVKLRTVKGKAVPGIPVSTREGRERLLDRVLGNVTWRKAAHPAGFSVEYTGVSREKAKALVLAAGLNQPLPRLGREYVLLPGVPEEHVPAIVLLNRGGKFELQRR